MKVVLLLLNLVSLSIISSETNYFHKKSFPRIENMTGHTVYLKDFTPGGFTIHSRYKKSLILAIDNAYNFDRLVVRLSKIRNNYYLHVQKINDK